MDEALNAPLPDDGEAQGEAAHNPAGGRAGGVQDHVVTHNAERTWRKRLGTFSGRNPTPNSELDHESWDLSAEELIDDHTLPDPLKRQLLLQSLCKPALGVARSLGRDVLPQDIVEVIRVSYGTAADGHSLLLKFYGTLQSLDELPSVYLQRLQARLRRVIDSGGTTEAGNFDLLLGQFCRGSHDEDVIRDLDLKGNRGGFVGFCQLLKAMKEEELRRREKKDLLSKTAQPQDHRGKGARGNVRNSAATVESTPDMMAEVTKAFSELSKSLEARIDARFTEFRGEVSASGGGSKDGAQSSSSTKFRDPNTKSGGKPRAGPSGKAGKRTFFCYKCGIDGHFRGKCVNPPNAELVFSRLNDAKKQEN